MYQNPFIPRILYAASGGHAKQCAAIGINTVLDNNFSRKTWTQREAILKQCAAYGVKLIPWFEGVGSYDDPNIDPNKSRDWNFWEGKKAFVLKYKNDERIYGWNTIQEPDIGDVAVDYIKSLYEAIQAYDPGGKPCFLLWDQWDTNGFRCQAGEFDIWTMDTGASGAADVQAFKDRLLRLNKYYHWIEIGKPAIAHFYKFEALEASFRGWQEVVPAGVVGTMYYNSAIILPNASIRAAIEAFHRSMGWWPVIPPETFTTHETTCPQDKSVFRVKVSSVAENNKALACPVDGTALPLEGVEITEIVAIPLIETLKEEIAALDKKIAELQGRIAETSAKISEIREFLGV